MQSLTIEVAPFTLREGVDEAEMLAASARLEREFLSKAAGYLGRSVSRTADGRWADIVLWRSAEDATALMPLIPHSDACAAYFSCMVGADTMEPGSGVDLFRSVRRYGAFDRVG